MNPIRTILVSLFLAMFASSALAQDKPNIVLVFMDNFGWGEPGFNGGGIIRGAATPRLDKLAAEGLRFTSGYSPAPLCTPTRRSILCGAATARCGSEFKSKWVPAEHMTIPKALKLASPNYRCAHFGKWGELMISTPIRSCRDMTFHSSSVSGPGLSRIASGTPTLPM